MSNSNDLTCKVCGLIQEEAPWGEDRRTPTFDFCPCCGVEFGYQDSSLEGVKSYRKQWMVLQKWAEPEMKPLNLICFLNYGAIND